MRETVALPARSCTSTREPRRPARAPLHFSGKSRTVTDGPFTETKELIAGFWLWQVRSIEEAVEWVKRCPNPMLTDSDIDIRPVFGPDDFGEAMTSELKAQETALRRRTEGHK